MVLSDRESVVWKLFVTCWAFMECILFGGFVYGWGSLNYVLKSEGIYADLCSQELPVNATPSNTINETSTESRHANVNCKSQDSRMALCFTIASSVLTVGCVIQGHMTYKYGTRIVRLIAFLIFTTGSLMMAFTSKENPWLMFPGLSCLGVGGIPLLVTNCQVANLFVKRSSSVVGVLSGCFDTSSIVMLLVKIASDNGVSRRSMFLTISAFHCLVLVSTFFFLPKNFIMKQQAKSKPFDVVKSVEGLGLLRLEQEGKAKVESPRPILPSLSCCLRSPMFMTHIVWLSLLQLRFFYFIATLNTHLERIFDGDEAKVSYFTNAFALILTGGLLTSLCAGCVHDWQKAILKDGKSARYRKVAPAAVPQGIASVLSVIMSILVLTPTPSLLYFTFSVITFKRAFLYSLAAAFISEVFPEEYFGVMYGIMIVCGGVIGFFQFALFTWSEAYENGAMHVDIFLLIMVCVSFIHPAYVWVSSWKEERTSKFT